MARGRPGRALAVGEQLGSEVGEHRVGHRGDEPEALGGPDLPGADHGERLVEQAALAHAWLAEHDAHRRTPCRPWSGGRALDPARGRRPSSWSGGRRRPARACVRRGSARRSPASAEKGRRPAPPAASGGSVRRTGGPRRAGRAGPGSPSGRGGRPPGAARRPARPRSAAARWRRRRGAAAASAAPTNTSTRRRASSRRWPSTHSEPGSDASSSPSHMATASSHRPAATSCSTSSTSVGQRRQ